MNPKSVRVKKKRGQDMIAQKTTNAKSKATPSQDKDRPHIDKNNATAKTKTKEKYQDNTQKIPRQDSTKIEENQDKTTTRQD